jgi:hypothetical protein
MRTSSPSRRSVPESARGSALVEGVLPLVTRGDPRCDLCGRAEAELAEDPREMRLHGLLAQEQLPGDLAVGTSGSHELGDLALPGAQRLESLLPRRPAPAPPDPPASRSSRTASSRSRCDPDAAAWRSAAVSCAIAASRSPAANARPPITRPRAASSAPPIRSASATAASASSAARRESLRASATSASARAVAARASKPDLLCQADGAGRVCLGGLQIPDSEVGFHEHGSPRTDPARRDIVGREQPSSTIEVTTTDQDCAEHGPAIVARAESSSRSARLTLSLVAASAASSRSPCSRSVQARIHKTH